MIRYLFTGIGFPPSGSGPNTCTQKAKNSNLHKEKQYSSQYTTMESKTCETMKKNKKENNFISVHSRYKHFIAQFLSLSNMFRLQSKSLQIVYNIRTDT